MKNALINKALAVKFRYYNHPDLEHDMVIFVAPVDDKCLKIDSASGLSLFSQIIEIESGISFSNISIMFKALCRV